MRMHLPVALKNFMIAIGRVAYRSEQVGHGIPVKLRGRGQTPYGRRKSNMKGCSKLLLRACGAIHPGV